MADKLENTARRVASASCAFLLFSKVFVEQGRGRVGPVLLQLIMAFMCSTFPSGQLLLVREGRGFSCRILALQPQGSCPVWVSFFSVNVFVKQIET